MLTSAWWGGSTQGKTEFRENGGLAFCLNSLLSYNLCTDQRMLSKCAMRWFLCVHSVVCSLASTSDHFHYLPETALPLARSPGRSLHHGGTECTEIMVTRLEGGCL